MKKYTLFLWLILGLLLQCSAIAQAQKADAPETVKIGVFVNNLYDLSMTNGECSATFWAWLVYKNDSLKIGDNFEVINSKNVTRQGNTTEKVNGLNWLTIKMAGKLQQDWFVHNFPFDTQKIVIRLESSLYDTRKMVFVPDVKGSKIDKNFALAGWDIKDFKIKNSPATYETNYGDPSLADEKSTYSAVDVEITIKRQSWGLFFKVFLGLYIALLISSLVFLVPSNDLNSKFGLAIGGLFAAVGNKYIVDSVLPESNVFTLSDQVHALTFSFIFIYILLSAIIHDIDKKGNEVLAKRIERFSLVAGPVIYALINIFLIVRS